METWGILLLMFACSALGLLGALYQKVRVLEAEMRQIKARLGP